MPSSSLIYDDQEQHLESIQTCQRNDNGIGAGLNIAAPYRRHSCERIRSPASFGFPTSIGRPDLTSGHVYFKDLFDGDGPLKEWVIPSKPDKAQGKFVVVTKKYSNESKSIGLKTTENARFYWMFKRFATHAITGDHDLIVQFSVALEQDIDCGGGYVKLFGLRTSQETLTDSTPYYIMFGPDIYGLRKRIVHVIINHNGTNYNCKSSPKCKDDVFTHVYMLHLYASNRSYEVRIDNESVQSGNLTDDWPILQPREIAYPSDAKPSDWDDRERIADPNDKIPDKWELPELTEDIEATKPDDWDDEADGDWPAPMKTNPAYMGKWVPRTIDNPYYTGPWIAKQISNPEYVEDHTIGIFMDIGLIGIDVWQAKSCTIFGDFLITDDVDLARQVAYAIVETSEKERTVKKKIVDKEMEKMRA
ncbi:hypothetical protein GJ496_002285 [Pomphorhynchus laevis]|nr:hypothetical protein GJ496_002285 [Pomphorhynchus laevis]